jgi:two-component system, chemotaxis family, protein-glutamate methylesterase/glutaminase
MTNIPNPTAAGSRGGEASRTTPNADAIRVMVVDDSAVIRGLITRILDADPKLQVVASVSDGQRAVERVAKTPIDVIILDIEMPVMDGLTALPHILKADPGVKILMASTLTLRNADISMKALRLGATDYIPKPTASSQINGRDEFGRSLLEKVRSLGQARRRQRTAAARPNAIGGPAAGPKPAPTITLRPASRVKPRIIAVGSSTGGPQALFKFLGDLTKQVKQPIVITQHMPPKFTTILAQHIAQNTGWPAAEATDGLAIEDGTIYIAPGDFHMIAEPKPGSTVLRLTTTPPENFCRPAVDPMLRSLSEIYGPAILTVILTGMGSDGLKGAQCVVEKGGTVIAQDEATSVVWGMPGAVATHGLCSAVLPLDQLAGHVARLANGGTS